MHILIENPQELWEESRSPPPSPPLNPSIPTLTVFRTAFIFDPNLLASLKQFYLSHFKTILEENCRMWTMGEHQTLFICREWILPLFNFHRPRLVFCHSLDVKFCKCSLMPTSDGAGKLASAGRCPDQKIALPAGL